MRLGQQEGGKASASTFLKGLDFNPKDDGKDSECPPRQFRARRVSQPVLSPEGDGGRGLGGITRFPSCMGRSPTGVSAPPRALSPQCLDWEMKEVGTEADRTH